MKKPSKKNISDDMFASLIGLGKSSIQKSYYPLLQKKISELEESERRYRLLADNITDVIWMTDLRYKFTYISPSVERLTGYNVDEIVNTRIDKFFPKDSMKIINRIFNHELNIIDKNSIDNSRKFEVEVIRKDGSLTWVEVVASTLFNEDGIATGFLGVSRDINERKNSEAERKKIRAQLIQAQKMESIGTLAGGIAHDFNNLLTIINGYSEMALLKLEESNPLHEDILSIKEAGQKAEMLTSQLLAFSRKQIYKTEIVNIDDVLLSIEKMLRRLIDEDIAIELKLAPKIPNIKADKSQLEQIFINLVVNARDALRSVKKANFQKKIRIQTGLTNFDSEFVSKNPGSTEGDFVIFSVSDNGVGMDEETRQKIFEPFFTTKDKFKGTGLGLSMVYGIVKQNKSYIDVISKPDEGTKFTIYWPVSKAERSDTDIVFYEENLNGTESILVVEDDIDVCRFAAESLKSLGYQVSISPNGKQALNLFSSYHNQFDLIITDLIMPELNGIEFIERVKTIIPDVKVIYVSGYTDDHIGHDGLLEENINFIQKPYTMRTLAQTVRQVLDSD